MVFESQRQAGGLKSTAQIEITRLKEDVGRLNRELTILRMICRALWGVVREQTQASEQDLSKQLSQLCGPDGEPIEPKQRTIVCEQCQRTVKRGTLKCHYCGHLNQPESVFDLLARW